ncbi:helix-turn-helix transcriptional regulator [Actinocatenispora sera]
MAQPDAVPAQRDRPTPQLLRRVVGRVLRRARQFQGRTLSEVAGAAQISMAYLSELERGRKEASSEVLAAVCTALGIDLTELLTEMLWDLSADRVLPGPGWRPGRGRPDVRLGLRDELDPLQREPAGSWADPTASLVAPTRLRLLRLSGGGAPSRFPVAPPSSPDVQCLAA